MQKQATKSLTKLLVEVQATLEDLQADIVNVVRDIEVNKTNLVNELIEQMQNPRDAEKEIFIRETLTDDIEETLSELNKAHNYLSRLELVIKNSSDISQKIEKTWWEKLKSVLEETRWYREHFPAQYEEKQRKQEYERYRLRPELYTKKFPEEEGISIRSSLRKQASAMGNITEQIQHIHARVLQLYSQFFSINSPIVTGANVLLKRLQNMEAKERDKTTKTALGDQMQMLENLFGTEVQPGRLIALGGSAFLMPTAHILQRVVAKLNELTSQLDIVPEVGKDLEHYFQSRQKKGRKNRILERMGIKLRQQKRCKLVQQIASSS